MGTTILWKTSEIWRSAFDTLMILRCIDEGASYFEKRDQKQWYLKHCWKFEMYIYIFIGMTFIFPLGYKTVSISLLNLFRETNQSLILVNLVFLLIDYLPCY